MPNIQSVYFAKDAITQMDEHGSSTMIRELRFGVYPREDFVMLVSLIDLDPKKRYDIMIVFFDSETNKSVYRIEGSLTANLNKPENLQSGFILLEDVSELPPISGDRYKIAVVLTDDDDNSIRKNTELLVLKEETPDAK
ncbi:hypothetical protein [Levilactobacillus brevis]|uniref:hypothetical protein n=1 Tax=Levilactobacillus brevis TaxID=1580 RepID=UPI000E08E77E|nr:hypothetical protein [Levilactobacillus brevis]RDF84457.1 hypothetical protein DQM16_09210 [Levilactobacillus brevis]